MAFSQLKINSIEEIENDEQKMAVYNRFMNELKMPDTYKEGDETIHGIEHYLPKDLYQQPVHHQAVAADIASGRDKLSKNGKFHAILATKIYEGNSLLSDIQRAILFFSECGGRIRQQHRQF